MISVILPAYNEEALIGDVISETVGVLNGVDDEWEVIVVDDGSTDNTLAVAKKAVKSNDGVRVLSYGCNRGKGFALKYGFEHSEGDLIVFMDADLDLHPSQIIDFIGVIKHTGADVVIGSKRHPESKVNYPFKRKLFSDFYFILIKLLFNLNVKDTQVGLKLFKRRALEEVMPRVLVKRYAFDIELLANIARRGYKIVEAPVELELKSASSVNWGEIWRMFVDTMAVAQDACCQIL